MWSVRVKVDPKTGIPTPQTVFDSVNIRVDENQVTISDKVRSMHCCRRVCRHSPLPLACSQILDTYSAQSLAKINKVSEHFQSFADDDMVRPAWLAQQSRLLVAADSGDCECRNRN